MPTKTYKDGQKIGAATHCIHCGQPLEKGIEGDSCRDITACTLRMTGIDLEDGAIF